MSMVTICCWFALICTWSGAAISCRMIPPDWQRWPRDIENGYRGGIRIRSSSWALVISAAVNFKATASFTIVSSPTILSGSTAARKKLIARALGLGLADLEPVRIDLQSIWIGVHVIDGFAVGFHVAIDHVLVRVQIIGIDDIEPHRLTLECIGIVTGRNNADLFLIELI